METIDLKEMFDYFKNKLSLVIFITVFIAIIGCLYGIFIQKPVYKSWTKIVLISDKNEVTFNEINLNKNLIGTYSEIIKSKRVLNRVCDNLNLDYDYGELSNSIEVTSIDNTEIIKITVANRDKKLAKKIANEIAEVFSEEVPELYSISNVNILDKAEVADAPSNINIPKQSILFIMVGLVLGCGVVFMMFYFDRSIKTKEQIEKLGLPVLGTVQDFNKKGTK